jgi:type III secretion protein T
VSPIDPIGTLFDSIAFSLPRIVAAFMMLPLLNNETMPALVRNSFFVSLAIVVYPVATSVPFVGVAREAWPFIILKELFIGTVYGFLFSCVFWALSAAGDLIDTKVGTNFTATLDPLQGHQTALTGRLLSQMGIWLFMASGAFTLFLELFMTSYRIWPIARMLPSLGLRGEQLVVNEFAALFTLSVMLAAPALVVMSLLDLSLGLINRFAPQLNVFSLTMPIKAWVGTWLVLLLLGTFLDVIIRRLFDSRGLLSLLRHVL